jgi:hypothetical protein
MKIKAIEDSDILLTEPDEEKLSSLILDFDEKGFDDDGSDYKKFKYVHFSNSVQ